ncbi:BamA/TamA family outer membrane protein [Aliivibrio kagoshimensis]
MSQFKGRYGFYLALLMFICPIKANQFSDPMDGYLDMGEYLANNAYGFMPIPIIVTEPSVGNGIGVAGLLLHESDEQKEKRKKQAAESIDGGAKLLTPALTVVGGLVTENDTKLGFAGHYRSFNQDSIRYLVGGGYGDINMGFYSQNLPNRDLNVTLNIKGGGLIQKLQFRVADSPLFIGVSQEFTQSTIHTEGRKLAGIIGDFVNLNPQTSGLGVIAEIDTKNSLVFPTNGMHLSTEYMWHKEQFGSDYEYDTFAIKATNYLPVFQNWTWGLKGMYNSLTSKDIALPVFVYPYIDLRGIPKYRYQGEAVIAIETQLMWEITPRWMTSIFGGGGATGENFEQAYQSTGQYTYGAGFRYTIARRYGLRVGIDLAQSREQTTYYINVGTGL